MKLNATLEKKVSAKSGKEYFVIEVKLTDTYTKQVFLDSAELELIKLSYSNKQ